MYRVGKMDTEGNSKEGKLENWMEEEFWVGLTRVEKIVMDLGWYEIVVNNRFEEVDATEENVGAGSTGGEKEKQMSGGEQWSCI